MKIIVDDKTFFLDFVHVNGINETVPSEKVRREFLVSGVESVRYTTAIIRHEDLSVAAMGTAHCHPNDTFDKRVGRKVALAKCLRGAPILMMHGPMIWAMPLADQKRVRGLVWKQYWERVKR